MKRHGNRSPIGQKLSRASGGPTRWLLLLVVLAMIAAACGGTAATTTEGSTETTSAPATTEAGPATTVAPSDEPVELTMWVSREQYLPTEFFMASLAETYPNITLTAELQPDDDLFFQLQRMADAGEPLPDLVQLDSFYAAPMLDLGITTDLTDLVAQWEAEDPDGFSKAPESLFFRHNGGIAGLATTGTGDGIYVRTDWLREAGIETPFESWDQVVEALRTLQAAHPDIIPWSMIATRGEGVNWLITLMSALGVEFEGAVPQIDSEAGQYIINFYQTLMKENLTTLDVLAWGEDEARGAWIGGRSAMMIDGIRSTNDIGTAIMDGLGITADDWALIPLPKSRTGAEEDGHYVLGTRTFHIPTMSEHPYEASLVLRLQMQTENAQDAAKSGAVYLQKDVLASDAFGEAYPFVSDDMLKVILEAESFPSASYFFEVVDLLEQMIQDILQNPDTPTEELAQKWQAELDAVSS